MLLVPEHNPVLLAKQAASLDALCGGRLTLGVGVGWSREEFEALGVPFERRGKRAAEYVAAMRALWREDVASFEGEFVSFDSVRVNPKPARDRRIPVVLGGNSDAALRRVAAWGDGWYGFNLAGVEAAGERLATLAELCREAGRDIGELRSLSRSTAANRRTRRRCAELGVDELCSCQAPPEDPGVAADWAASSRVAGTPRLCDPPRVQQHWTNAGQKKRPDCRGGWVSRALGRRRSRSCADSAAGALPASVARPRGPPP